MLTISRKVFYFTRMLFPQLSVGLLGNTFTSSYPQVTDKKCLCAMCSDSLHDIIVSLRNIQKTYWRDSFDNATLVTHTACVCVGVFVCAPSINSLGCPLEVLPVQGRGRRAYQLSLGCLTTHDGIWEARCFYFEPKCHEQCESKVLCLYLVIIWYFVVPKWHNHSSKVSERCGLSKEM